ncbi:MAG: M48 family metalloprotease, partial [Phycisphaerae bacterium]|nr:M48 family metalloprotease [Phycisphaerae bacterium]
IPFYLLFALLSMLVVGGACELAWRVFHVDPSYISIGALFLIAATWGVAFGWVSRRFERQADLFGARLVTPPADACTLPCKVHHEAEGIVPVAKALCATGAHTFAGALHRIAALNGIPEEARSWRHSSIASRMRFLEELAADPAAVRRFSRTILVIRVVLVIGTVIGLAVAVWLYSDQM